MNKKNRLRLLAVLSVIVLLLSACGGGGEPSAAAHEHSNDHHGDSQSDDGHQHDDHHHGDHSHEQAHSGMGPINGAREIRIVAREFSFEPSTIELREGEPVNIVFKNDGTEDHEITIEALGFHAHAMPGETVTVGLVPEQAGEFELGCFVPGHYEAGMKGQVIVEAAS